MKRTISILLTMTMILSLLAGLSITASADIQAIFRVDINNVTEPVVGETATIEGITVPENANYTVNATWQYYDFEEMCFRDFTGTFADQNIYRLCLNLDAEEGYYLGNDMEMLDAPVYINGEEETYVYGEQGFVTKEYFVGAQRISDTISIDGVPEAVPGESISTGTITYTGPSTYALAMSAKWQVEEGEDNWKDVSEGIFEEGKNYRIALKITVDSGYMLDIDPSIRVNGSSYESNWYIQERTASSITFCSLGDAIPIETVEINNLPEVKAGEILPTQGSTGHDDALYSMEYTWRDIDGSIVTGTAWAGHAYRLCITVTPSRGDGTHRGYYFPNDVVCYVEGEKWSDYELDWDRKIYINGLVVFASSDAEQTETQWISDVVINNVRGAIAGEKATAENITIPKNANYSVNVTWECYDFEEMRFCDFTGGTFSKGNLYRQNLEVIADEGYIFSSDWDCSAIYINGEYYGDLYGERDTIQIEYASGSELVSYIEIDNVPQAIRGKPISTDGITGSYREPGMGGYPDINIAAKWYVEDEMGNWQEISEGVFEPDKNYRIALTITLDGYMLETRPSILINGDWYDDNWYIRERTANSVTLWPLGDAVYIETVEIDDLPEVKLGEMLPTPKLTIPDDALYSVSCTWYDSDNNIVTGPAKADESYRLEISVTPSKGDGTYKGCYLHWNAVCYLDGEKWDNVELDDMEGLYMNISVPYSFDYEIIDKVELTVAEPALGETPGAVSIPENANYTLDQAEWGVASDETLEDAEKMEGAFEAGNYYLLGTALKPKEGYVFSEKVVVTVNGKPIDLDFEFNDISYFDMQVFHSFGKLTENDTTDPTAPGIGGEGTNPSDPTDAGSDKPGATEATTPAAGNNGGDKNEPTDPSNPSTGDTFTLITAVALMLSSAMGMGITAAKGKRSAR